MSHRIRLVYIIKVYCTLDFVKTASAKSKIKSSLKEAQKEIASQGKEILTRKLRHIKIPFNENTLNELVNFFNLKTSQDLFVRFGNGNIENAELKKFAAQRSNTFLNFFKTKIRKKNENQTTNKNDDLSLNYDMLVFGKDEEKLEYKKAKCCAPIPGDKVFGFITINEGIKIHKYSCPNAVSLQANYAYRILPAKWIDSKLQEHKVVLILKGVDHDGLVGEVSNVISQNQKVKLYNINISGGEGYFEGKITVGINNNEHLKKLMTALKKIDGIEKIRRQN